MKFFGIDTDPIFGLDMSSSALKLMMLQKNGSDISVERYFIQQLLSNKIRDKRILDTDYITETLKHTLACANISTKNVCLAVPNSITITKKLDLPIDLTDKEIENEIYIEADKYIPYALDEINIDYQILSRDEEEGKIEVFIIACKSDDLNARIEIAENAGLNPVIVDVDSYATGRAFNEVLVHGGMDSSNSLTGLIDIGSNLITLNIFKGKRLIYTKEQAFGGIKLMEEIQSRYGLTFEEALAAKKFNDLPDDYAVEVLQPYKVSLTQQINRACQFFFSNGKYHTIDKLYLTGGVSNINGLADIVQETLKIKTLIANPFANLLVSDQINIDRLYEDSSTLMTTFGLELRNIN
jgi:type IV pilus assembly protein PilM